VWGVFVDGLYVVCVVYGIFGDDCFLVDFVCECFGLVGVVVVLVDDDGGLF